MPKTSLRSSTRLLAWGATAAVALLAGCAVVRLHDAAELAKVSEPYQHPLAQPQARMLIVGDSTAVGTGASAPQASLAGLLAQAYPGLLIENRGRDGATFAEIPSQLERDGARFDVVLVLAGGNDVIRLSDLDVTPSHLQKIAQLAKARADQVVFMPAGNVGNAPFFFPPVSWWMASRARQMHAAVRETAAQQGAGYVNLFKERQDDPFAQHKELNARDGLHPSDSGYQVWFKELQTQSRLADLLAAAKPA